MFPASNIRPIELPREGSRSARLRWIAALLVAGSPSLCAARAPEVAPRDSASDATSYVITNVAQIRSVPWEIFLGRCAFDFNGIVTLVETNRNLLVLQDGDEAVALSPSVSLGDFNLLAGQSIAVRGSRCFPYVESFPNYPYRPSGWDLRPSFEAPSNWGEYHLTRMRGFLHPPASGEYVFWIASDNSSELWLSPNEDPGRAKKIASLGQFRWVNPREWSHYPSQRSESVFLKSGQTYYIEALQEQTTVGDHLAVAWQGPSLGQAVIENPYLTPWIDRSVRVAARQGILREYWTNYSVGGLTTLSVPRPFETMLSVDDLQVKTRGAGVWPEPQVISLNQPLRPGNNFRWAQAQGEVSFIGKDGEIGFLELCGGGSQVQVRLLRGQAESLRQFHKSSVRVEGVCEGAFDQKGAAPVIIWVPTEHGISVIDTPKTNVNSFPAGQASGLGLTHSNTAMIGFYATRGVVTFNDRVLGKDYLFVQEDNAAMLVSLKDRNFENQFEVGRAVEFGGAFQPGKNIPVINPLVMTELGWRPMPVPITQPVQVPVPGNRDGHWTEAEGVVQSANSNTVVLMTSGGPLSVWIGKTDSLKHYVDARLRVRGVLSLAIQDTPWLLVPSTRFVDVERDAPNDPFALPVHSVSNLFATDLDAALAHRVKLAGTVTFHGNGIFFMQDSCGGVRVQPVEDRELQIGQAVEVVGFPSADGSVRTLTEALVRPAGSTQPLRPHRMDAGEGISLSQAGLLIQITANLIAQRNREGSQVLELQERQRVLEAELPEGQAALPSFAPGSRLRLTGIYFATVARAASGKLVAESPPTGALKLWLRSPADVALVSGPPWWTWKLASALVGTLITVLIVSLLRIHLLRRRLARQLAFSRQILESQENERRRIAANLHDSLGQNLSVIKYQARLALQPATDEAVLRQRLDAISGCASQAIDEVREITYALRPYQLDRLGLTQAIRATVNRAAENSSILFASHADDIDGLLDPESEIHVYRIVQEGVNNILKHSAATEAAVVVKKQASAISLSIRDNGRGFDPGAIATGSNHDVGHGIDGIHERIRILGGTFLIDSRPGQGTSLSTEIPIPAPRHET